MIVDFAISPVGAGESLSAYVAEAFAVIDASGLPHEHHAMGTNLEGDWDEVIAVVKACRDRMLDRAGRVSISLRIDDRKGASGRLETKVPSAEAKIRRT